MELLNKEKSVKLNNGVEMPLIGLGTYTLRGEECIKVVSEAVNIGYRLIDTAQMYGNEREIGNAIKHYKREDLFITTKLYSPSASYERAKSESQPALSDKLCNGENVINLHFIFKVIIFAPDFLPKHP